jgi:16S rRNA (guanine966-N2)-methyltransferase
VLDLFAGSGALGLEALSRGAASATFVERDRGALIALRGNLAELGAADRATVAPFDVARFLAAAGPGPAWGWVFLDPPYAAGVAEATLAALPRGRLTDDAVVIVEHAHRAPPPERAGFLLRTHVRRYGDTALSLYRIEAS